jgi:peptidyl-prolyl cis-trans isomerase A (cyclophilin A)
VFHTSLGDFIAQLFPRQAPQTVNAFVELATGKRRWKHPITDAEMDRPLFNNTLIYKIIPDSMVFGGDPINKGTADAGFQLPVEVSPDLGFNEAGLLAMDLNGTFSSSSRWYVTLRPYPDRTGQYTIFGKVVGGLDLVRKISKRPQKRPQLPLDPAILSSIEILEIPQNKAAMAMFETELDRKVLSINSGFQEAPAPPTAQTTADVETTPSESAAAAP